MIDLRKEVRDQLAHMVWAAFVLGPVMIWPSVMAFAFAGFMVGLVREVTEERTPFTPIKVAYAIATSKLDLFFWTIGAGLTAYLLGV